jgi:hypothetical protein
MKLYKVKLLINKRGNQGQVDIHAKDERLILDNLETAESVYNEFLKVLEFNTKCMKKLSGYVAIYEPTIQEDGTITNMPLNGEYLKKYKC